MTDKKVMSIVSETKSQLSMETFHRAIIDSLINGAFHLVPQFKIKTPTGEIKEVAAMELYENSQKISSLVSELTDQVRQLEQKLAQQSAQHAVMAYDLAGKIRCVAQEIVQARAENQQLKAQNLLLQQQLLLLSNKK
jgi:hypothetical protein